MGAWAGAAVPAQTEDPYDMLTTRFLSGFAAMVGDWAAWAAEEVGRWPEDAFAGRPDG